MTRTIFTNGLMKHCLIAIFFFVSLLTTEDSITFTIKGGRPLPGETASEPKITKISGKDFESLRPDVEKIVKLLGDQKVWTDLGPDARYMSAVIKLGDKEYTLNSWHPLHRDKPLIAVSEKNGLVLVSSREEKEKVESKNSERYRTLVSIFNYGPNIPSPSLTLKITLPSEPIRVGGYPKFIATIHNETDKNVVLVQPGDGSSCRWRTPWTGWSVIPPELWNTQHPTEPEPMGGSRCGNINTLRLKEVFTLKPGESKNLTDWIEGPTFSNEGKYRVVFYFKKAPKAEVQGHKH
jgi:hypothetical protein